MRYENGEIEMNINGLQKMTLLDYPGKVACTVFLAGCDMRCPFCHNAELLDASAPVLMQEDELLAFLKKRQGLLDGVAFTGGEPLLRKELPELLKKIRELGFLIKLDTNGNHPERLKQILDETLADYVAMDIKNSPERYAETAGLKDPGTGRISESIEMLMTSSTDYEFRTTCIRQFHDADSIKSIAEWINGAKNYYLQNFTDRETVPFAGLEGFTREELESFAEIAGPYVKNVGIRGI